MAFLVEEIQGVPLLSHWMGQVETISPLHNPPPILTINHDLQILLVKFGEPKEPTC